MTSRLESVYVVRDEIFIITSSNKKDSQNRPPHTPFSDQFTINEGYKLRIKLYIGTTTLELFTEYSFIPYTHTTAPTIFLHQS